MCPPNCTLTVRAGELGAECDSKGQGSVPSDMTPSHTAQPEEQRQGWWPSLPQPSNVCPQLCAAGGNTTVTPGAPATLRALMSPGLDLHQFCRLSTHRQDPALPSAQEKGFALVLFCNAAAVSGPSTNVSYNTTLAFYLCLWKDAVCDRPCKWCSIPEFAIFWQQKEVTIYHPGENGQVKNKSQVLFAAPPPCTWCSSSGLSPDQVLLQWETEHPALHPMQQPQPASPGRDGGPALGTSCPS